MFFQSIIPFSFEISGTDHYWLNRSVKNEEFFGIHGTFLVLAANNFDCGIMFQKLKAIQERYRKVIISIPPKLDGIRDGHFIIVMIIIKNCCRFPHITIMGIKLINSSDRENQIQFLMTENITFPILLSQRTFPQVW